MFIQQLANMQKRIKKYSGLIVDNLKSFHRCIFEAEIIFNNLRNKYILYRENMKKKIGFYEGTGYPKIGSNI